jgi:hypothetical protein
MFAPFGCTRRVYRRDYLVFHCVQSLYHQGYAIREIPDTGLVSGRQWPALVQDLVLYAKLVQLLHVHLSVFSYLQGFDYL